MNSILNAGISKGIKPNFQAKIQQEFNEYLDQEFSVLTNEKLIKEQLGLKEVQLGTLTNDPIIKLQKLIVLAMSQGFDEDLEIKVKKDYFNSIAIQINSSRYFSKKGNPTHIMFYGQNGEITITT